MDKNGTHLFGVTIILLLSSLIKNLFLNLFLAFTTAFPFVLIMNGLGSTPQDSSALNWYREFLSITINFLFHKTLDTVSTGQLVTLFFLVVLVISGMISAVNYLFGKYVGTTFKIRALHVIIFMSLMYIIASSVTYMRDPDNLWFMGILTFYLFNVFSVFSYGKIAEETKKLRIQYPQLNKFPF